MIANIPEPSRLAYTTVVRSVVGHRLDPCLRSLEELYGDELGDDLVLSQLAEVIETTLVTGCDEELLERCCDALERLCELWGHDGREAVTAHVLAALSPAALGRLEAWLGPETAALAEDLADPDR